MKFVIDGAQGAPPDGALVRLLTRAHSLARRGDEPERNFGGSRRRGKHGAWTLTDGARVVAIDENGADIVTARGARQRYYRQLAV